MKVNNKLFIVINKFSFDTKIFIKETICKSIHLRSDHILFYWYNKINLLNGYQVKSYLYYDISILKKNKDTNFWFIRNELIINNISIINYNY